MHTKFQKDWLKPEEGVGHMTPTLCILLWQKMAIKVQHKIVTKINLRFMAKGYMHIFRPCRKCLQSFKKIHQQL